jgi:hypothetical protein
MPGNICNTWLTQTGVDLETRAVEDNFRLEPSSYLWQLDDHWLARLAHRLPEKDERHCALRLLVLHELAHRGPQRLTSTSSQEIGRFPKVVEEIDYHADLWAMLHEHALASLQSPDLVASPPPFFRQIIRIATQTMWAFDDDGEPLHEIQIRRLNRYLIWYWQCLRLELEGAAGATKMSLEDVLAILAQRPTLELAGPRISARNERIVFDLDLLPGAIPELAIYHQGELHRHGRSITFDIHALLQAVKRRDAEGMLAILRAVAEQTMR